VLAISATITFHVSQVAELIAAVRASGAGRGVRILVGGYPFNVAPELWRNVGADGFARNAQDALGAATRLAGQGATA
jgi:methanogenic corrinoid protein MtbC1